MRMCVAWRRALRHVRKTMAEFDGSSDESPSFMEEGNRFEVKKRKLDILRQVDNMTTVAVLPMG